MENVLEVYQRPYDPKNPVVCMDETSKQLVRETRAPITAEPGRVTCYDYEYERHGVANVFMFCEPLGGWRRASITDRRTKLDWAQQIKDLVDVHYAQADQVTLVMDNLNTHTPASLYEAFERHQSIPKAHDRGLCGPEPKEPLPGQLPVHGHRVIDHAHRFDPEGMENRGVQVQASVVARAANGMIRVQEDEFAVIIVADNHNLHIRVV